MKLIIKILITAFIGVLVWVFMNNGSNTSIDLCAIELSSQGTGGAAIVVPRSYRQPWRLRFRSTKVNYSDASPEDRVSCFIKNKNPSPLELFVGDKFGNIVLQPGESTKIFTGNLKQFLVLGRTDTEELVIKSSSNQSCNMEIYFDCKTQFKEIDVIVTAWRLIYSF